MGRTVQRDPRSSPGTVGRDDANRVAEFRRLCGETLPFGLGVDDALVAAILREIGPSADDLRLAALLLRARPPGEIVATLRYGTMPDDADSPSARLFALGEERFARSREERAAWVAASLFDGFFGLAEADAVFRACDVPEGEDRLGELVTRGVVVRTRSRDSRRMLFRVPAVHRRPALAALEADPLLHDRARDGLLEHWSARAAIDRDTWWAPRQRDRLAEARTAAGDIAMLIDDLYDRRRIDVLRLITRLLPFWMVTAREGLDTERLVDAIEDPAVPQPLREDVLYMTAWLTMSPDEYPWINRSLAARCDAGGPGVARFEQVRGLRALYAGDADTARGALERAVAGHTESGDEGHLLFDLSLVASAASLQGDQQTAFDYCERAVRLCEKYGAPLQRNYALWTFALSAWRDDDPGRAYVLALEGATTAAALEDEYILAICIEIVAWYESAHGDAERAARLFGVADDLRVRLRIPILLFNTREHHDLGVALAERRLGKGPFWRAHRQGQDADLDDAVGWLSAPGPGDALAPTLTPRQHEIADLIAEGRTNKEIARLLLITVSTVESHVENIFAKLGVVSRAQVAAWSASASGRAAPRRP